MTLPPPPNPSPTPAPEPPPALTIGGARIPSAAIISMSIADKPLTRDDQVAIALLTSALPDPLPAACEVDGFGEFTFTAREDGGDDNPEVARLTAKKQTALGSQAAQAILDALRNNELIRTNQVFIRWHFLATRAGVPVFRDGTTYLEFDQTNGVQRLISQWLSERGGAPDIATLQRELPKRGYMIIEGEVSGYAIGDLGFSVVPLGYERGGEVKRLPDGAVFGKRVLPLANALQRPLEFGVQGEIVRGGAAGDDGAAVHIGDFERANYGVIAMEMRRYYDLLTGETTSVTLPYAARYRVADAVLDRAGREWRVAGVYHAPIGGATTRLDLVRRHSPSNADISRHSPPPFDRLAASNLRLQSLPAIPVINPLISVRSGSETIALSDVGGAAAVRIQSYNALGKPHTGVIVSVVRAADSVVARRQQFPLNGIEPILEARFLGLPGNRDYQIQASLLNEYGTGAVGGVDARPVVGAPAMTQPIALTARDADALTDGGRMLGAAADIMLADRQTASASPGIADSPSQRFAAADVEDAAMTRMYISTNEGRRGASASFSGRGTRAAAQSLPGIVRPLVGFLARAGPGGGVGANDARLLVYVAIDAAGNERVAARGQYRIGSASGQVTRKGDVQWGGWQDWRDTPVDRRPRGTDETPNPYPVGADGGAAATNSLTWLFALNIGRGGVRGGQPTDMPYLDMQFRAVVVDESGADVAGAGNTSSWRPMRALDMRQWQDGGGNSIRHYEDDGSRNSRPVDFW